MRNDFLNYSKPNFYYFKFLIAYNWSNISSINVSKFESVATKELNWRGMVIFLSETIESSVQLPFLNSERIHNWNASPSTSPPPSPPAFQVPWFLLFVFTATSNSASYLPRACNSSRFTPRRFRAFSMQENMTRRGARVSDAIRA